MSKFEDRLWSDLVRDHAAQMRPVAAATVGPSRRRPAILTGTAVAVAGLAAAAILAFTAATSTPPAYAVTPHSDGTVTVTLHDISAIATLNAELARDGIRAKAVRFSDTCPVHAPIEVMPARTDPDTYAITIVPRDIPAGYTAILAASRAASGRVELVMGAIRPPVPACFNTTPRRLHPIDAAHASPALRAAIKRARAALAQVRR